MSNDVKWKDNICISPTPETKKLLETMALPYRVRGRSMIKTLHQNKPNSNTIHNTITIHNTHPITQH